MSQLINLRIALIGCGDIGCRLARHLFDLGAEVHGFRRNIATLEPFIIPHAMDITDISTLNDLTNIAFDYVVITLSPNEMSDSAYHATYVMGLQNILLRLNQQKLRKLLWVSSTSVYGQEDGSEIDENSPTLPTRYSGKRQLEAEQLLNALAEKACVVRFAGIYRDTTHRLIDQLLVGKLSNNIKRDYVTNRIHINDCVGILQHLIQLDAQGIVIKHLYLGVDSSPVLYSELINWLACQLNLPLSSQAEPTIPRVGSKRCLNHRIINSGYQFTYPTYQAGFTDIIKQYGLLPT